jgi:hypothetical protein
VAPTGAAAAVNVTVSPLQKEIGPEALTVGCGNAVTAIVIELDVAGDPVAQVAFDVITQVTTSPSDSEEFVYVVLFVPTLDPFNFHW